MAEKQYAVVALEPPNYKGWHGAGQADDAPEPEEGDPALGLLLHYHVPAALGGGVQVGQMVIVPLRGKPTYGVVVELAESAPVEDTRPISRVLDARPVVPLAMMALARWIAGHYRCTLWQALAPMLPPGVARRAVTTLSLSYARAGTEGDEGGGRAGEAAGSARSRALMSALGRRQKQVVALLEEAPRHKMTLGRLKRNYKGATSGLDTALRGLEREGLVTRQVDLPGPRSRPQAERVIRLAVEVERAREAMGEQSHRAPLQAAALDWLVKRTGARDQGSGIRDRGLGIRNQGLDTEDSEPIVGAEKAGWLVLSELYLHTGATSGTVAALEKKGLVELDERPVFRKPVPQNVAGGPQDEPPTLTQAQAAAWREIAAALRQGPGTRDQGPGIGDQGPGTRDRGPGIGDQGPGVEDKGAGGAVDTDPRPLIPGPFLLHGVTGSGKTEIYLRAIGMALRMGRQAIVLVPEISLTPQAVHRFASRFPGRVALIHSQLSAGQQFDEWRRIRDGQADIVVGSRSAVFAPLPRLGLIVVDEEHEWAYKQSEHQPRYHARDVALKRAELTGSVAILGSATPDIASYHAAQMGDFRLLPLPYRVGRRRTQNGSELLVELPLPPVQVVDMRAELKAGNSMLFSRALASALDATMSRGEQAILYLNRRGSHSFMLCRECGYVPMCKRCDVPLVYHADIHGMLCHRCNAFSLVPRECPKCGSDSIRWFGVGTQKVVDEVAALFPKARILRWDRDTASRQGGHADLMDTFARGEADVLVGTQMIAKGLDIARVTLVGVVSADTGLYMPDFRAPERALQLLMQVAGRAGRRTESAHSRVVVQTFNPEHYAVQAAAAHDYVGFYRGEIRFRAEHGYPPFGQLARLVYSSFSNEKCEQTANLVARHLRYRAERLSKGGELDGAILDVIGPAPCFVHKIRGRYRWQVLLRADNLAALLDGFSPGPGWVLDVEPMSVL
jgi:primosomal protein N' (replication factor Y)